MARDARQLRDEAAAAVGSGKHKRALECYLELERLEPTDAQWPKRAGETYRRLGKPRDAVAAFERAAERYAQNGFLVQAIAVCKLILQIDPSHVETQQRLAAINAAQGAGPTRIGSLSEHHPSLHENPAVALLRGRTAAGSRPPEDVPAAPAPPGDRNKPASRPPVVSFVGGGGAVPTSVSASASADALARPVPVSTSARAQSQPIFVPPGHGLDSVALGSVVAGARQQRDDGSQPGIVVIPIDADDSASVEVVFDEATARTHRPASEPAIEIDLSDPDDPWLAQAEEIPLAAPRRVGAAARQALASTPLFSGLGERQLEALIGRIELATLAPGQVLFREGERGDALYVIAEGEVVVQAVGPPRIAPALLKAGAFFGEVTLITDHPRMVTVTAQTMVEVLRIDRAAMAFVLARHPEMVSALLRFVRDRLVERWMRTSPLCRPFAEREAREFVGRFRFLEIEAGSVLMAPGELADGLYILLAGQLVARRGGQDAAVLGPGELIGETGLMTGAPLQSEVVARSKCLSLWLPAEDFHEVILIHPHVLAYIGEQVERRRLQLL